MENVSGLLVGLIWLVAAVVAWQVMDRAGFSSRSKWAGFSLILIASIIYECAATLMAGGEEAEELLDLIWDWNFVNIAAAALIILVVGTGILRTKYKGVVWGISIAVLWAALHVGIGRHEWGEVFFNGTLL
ncbi:MAG: hypothetical protein C0609_00830 [Deltaproteobacteria bacterium]|nr:MAG: hypothetical protein C0609_00830 [Deltaproteobacteria bacterium]